MLIMLMLMDQLQQGGGWGSGKGEGPCPSLAPGLTRPIRLTGTLGLPNGAGQAKPRCQAAASRLEAMPSR